MKPRKRGSLPGCRSLGELGEGLELGLLSPILGASRPHVSGGQVLTDWSGLPGVLG